jgi:hypothetical protein
MLFKSVNSNKLSRHELTELFYMKYASRKGMITAANQITYTEKLNMTMHNIQN